MMDKPIHELNRQRRAGVLLHPSSFPGELGSGDIGHQAYRFIEFLNANGFRLWQMLPLGPTHDDRSPYQCLSSHAGNPLLISIDWLIDKGWLDKNHLPKNKSDADYRQSCLLQAADTFYAINDAYWQDKLIRFRQDNAYWLDDYALFVILKEHHQGAAWYDWPKDEKHRQPQAMEAIRQQSDKKIKQIMFEQFIFFSQWQEIRDYARHHNIELFGDMPIFVARDSADVWAQKENFLIDEEGEMEYVAGVPPDAFSDTGQRWGNPLYNWEYMQANGFQWWKDRFRTQLKLFDIVRIDHFRGLQACWYIPQQDETAANGQWVEVPGDKMLAELFSSFKELPVIAEDLGVITDDVIALKKQFQMPGMKVLQFAFDGSNQNPHLPHHHEPADVIYTGTHDNDTSLGWALDENNYNKDYFKDYIHSEIESPEMMALSLMRLAMASVSFLCVIPMQDLLMLDSSARMNIPGTVGDNWNWRFDWQQLRPDILEQLSHYMQLYQR